MPHSNHRVAPSLATVPQLSRRQLLYLTSLAIGGPMLSACSTNGNPASAAGTPPSKPTGTLRVANNAEPTTLDPTIATNVADIGILMHNVYEPLLRYREGTTELEGVLAESFQSSLDAREWTFRLRRGITFHDGEPLTSAAVKASFQYAKESGGAYGHFLPDDAHYDDKDPAALRITTRAPFPDMARNVSLQAIISPKLIASGAEGIKRNPTGTGPFTFASYKTAADVVLEGHDSYWGDAPYLDRVEFPIIPDPDGRVAALRSGSVDLVLKLAPTNAAPLYKARGIKTTTKPTWFTSKLFLYVKTPPMDNLQLRQALWYGIDRDALVKSILANTGGRTYNSWTVPGIYGYEEPKTTHPYNPDRARELIAQSGLPTPIEITAAFAADPGGTNEQMARAIAGMLKPVGVNLNVVSKQPRELSEVHSNEDGKPRPWHAMVSARTYISGGAGHCLAFTCLQREDQVSDPTLERLSDLALATPDGPQRLKVFAEIEEHVARLAPLITLYEAVDIHAHRDSIQGFVAPQDGLHPRYASVYLAG